MAGPFKVVGGEGQVICWMVANEALKSGWEHCSARRGDVIELPDAEAERLEAYLGDPDAPDEPPTAAAEAGGFTPVSDDEIDGMTVEQVHAYLGQVPEDDQDDEITRIVEREQLRDKPRTSVLSLDPDFEAHPDDDLQSQA